MRFATVRQGDRHFGARVDGDRFVLLDACDALEAWASGGRLTELGEVGADSADLAEVSPRPAHIICAGLNYRGHALQLGRALPTYPALFAKYCSTLTGPHDPIPIPSVSDLVQGEAELAVVIGRQVHRAEAREARDAIAGYTIANDLSMRDWQHRTTEALQGKVFDRSTPLGPVLVTPDELDDASDLRITFHVDDVEWQDGTTADMLWSPAELIAYCSQFVTLERGDVILTGTPEIAAQEARLRGGSVLRTAIEGIGECVNRTHDDGSPETLPRVRL